MSNTMLAEIVLPVVVAVALVVWISALYRARSRPGYSRRGPDSRPWRQVIRGTLRGSGGRQLMPPSADDLRELPDTRQLEESGTDYVDFGAPERVRRS
jgi:hypothetical protein